MHCEINVKLVFHEMQGKKNFTVYSSLNKFQRTENIQKQLFRSILQDSFFKILKYSQEISMVEIVSTQKSFIGFV